MTTWYVVVALMVCTILSGCGAGGGAGLTGLTGLLDALGGGAVEEFFLLAGGGDPDPSPSDGGGGPADVVPSPIVQNPEPASVLLLGSALAGLGVWKRKRG